MSRDQLSLTEARRIALSAQGFARRRSRRVVLADLRRVIRQLSLLQLDFVNVLVPSHYQVLFSRLGPYNRALLDDLVYRRREFTEHWAHEASIVPVESWPLLRHRMAAHRVRPYGFEAFLEEHPAYVQGVLDEVRNRGPLTGQELAEPDGLSRRIPGAWVSVPRAVLEAHFGRGILAVAGRQSNFARVYDLAERVVPVEHLGRSVEHEEAQRELLRLAARSLGIATATDLADYFRMPVRETRPRLAELIEAGDVCEVQVERWREPAYLVRRAELPRQLDAAALLSPFDPLIWHRPRALRLFEFDYRFEIFVPPSKRRWGCYVLPFLLGDRLVARVDLKADRSVRRLLVVAAYLQPGARSNQVAEALAAELRVLSEWLGLETIAVGSRGNFALPLAAAIRA